MFEKELILQEQIELTRLMPEPPLMKELWKHGAIQFGYIFFFLISFPMTALVCFIFNVIHVNGLYISLTHYTKRRPSVERRSIGVWNKIFFVLTFLALVINFGMLTFSSDGVTELFTGKLNKEVDSKTIVVLLVILEHVAFVIKICLSVFINRTPLWVKRILDEQNERKQKDLERIKKKHVLNKNRIKNKGTRKQALDKFKNNARQSLCNLDFENTNINDLIGKNQEKEDNKDDSDYYMYQNSEDNESKSRTQSEDENGSEKKKWKSYVYGGKGKMKSRSFNEDND